jgi:hypothetical protein
VKSSARSVLVRVDARRLTPKVLDDMVALFRQSKGPCPVHVHVRTAAGDAQLVLGPDWRVDAGDAVLSGLERVFGASVAELR